MLAGKLEVVTANVPYAWSITLFIAAGLMMAMWAYHSVALPRPDGDVPACSVTASTLLHEFMRTFRSFFRKEGALVAVLFMLLYRLPEAQLVKMEIPFLKDALSAGGLGLSTAQIGVTQGTVGIIGLVIGGIIGGLMVSRHGLRRLMWWMVCAISLPDAVFVYLSYFPETPLLWINVCVFIEQLGYGFGFTAYMMFMIYFSRGKHSTAHYAICTAFMALGMMLPGMAAGWIQEALGYTGFFWWIMLCCGATFGVTALLDIDPEFGKK